MLKLFLLALATPALAFWHYDIAMDLRPTVNSGMERINLVSLIGLSYDLLDKYAFKSDAETWAAYRNFLYSTYSNETASQFEGILLKTYDLMMSPDVMNAYGMATAQMGNQMNMAMNMAKNGSAMGMGMGMPMMSANSDAMNVMGAQMNSVMGKFKTEIADPLSRLIYEGFRMASVYPGFNQGPLPFSPSDDQVAAYRINGFLNMYEEIPYSQYGH